MTSFLNYVKATLRALFARRGSFLNSNLKCLMQLEDIIHNHFQIWIKLKCSRIFKRDSGCNQFSKIRKKNLAMVILTTKVSSYVHNPVLSMIIDNKNTTHSEFRAFLIASSTRNRAGVLIWGWCNQKVTKNVNNRRKHDWKHKQCDEKDISDDFSDKNLTFIRRCLGTTRTAIGAYVGIFRKF